MDSSQKDPRTKDRKRLAVYAASMQWADVVKVVSRGTPRSRASVTWGSRWSVSAAENYGEGGGRHAHLLGLICRSHFPAQAQAEESEDGRWLDWDRGKKEKQNHRERREDHLCITEKSNRLITEPWGRRFGPDMIDLTGTSKSNSARFH